MGSARLEDTSRLWAVPWGSVLFPPSSPAGLCPWPSLPPSLPHLLSLQGPCGELGDELLTTPPPPSHLHLLLGVGQQKASREERLCLTGWTGLTWKSCPPSAARPSETARCRGIAVRVGTQRWCPGHASSRQLAQVGRLGVGQGRSGVGHRA